MHRSTSVRTLALLIASALAGFTQGQSVAEMLPPVQELLEAIQGTTSDAARDTLYPRLEERLYKVLSCDDAHVATLENLPLARVDAPDGRFRLISWNRVHSDGKNSYGGFLLVREPQRNVLFRLKEGPHSTHPLRRNGPDQWQGALYYTVVPKTVGKQTYYTLLGWKGIDRMETQKVIDVLSFNGAQPVFGAPLFVEAERRERPLRKTYAFSARSSMVLRWEPENNAIVLDHLAPERPDLGTAPAWMVPSMSYDAYVWHKGKWHYMRDIDARNPDRRMPKVKPIEKRTRTRP